MANNNLPILPKKEIPAPAAREKIDIGKREAVPENEKGTGQKFEMASARKEVLREIEKPKIASQPQPSSDLIDLSNQQKAQRARQKEIEKIMEDNLQDAYLSLPPDKQLKFKAEGEKAAIEISSLIDKGKASLKKIIELIKKWLSLIPGVNKYFLEQEAKIKADKILENKNFDG